MSTAVVIVAAGTGSRAGGDLPKQYQLIGGKPVLWWTLKAFCDHPGVSHVQTVIGPGQEALFAEASAGLPIEPAITGGKTRQESCRLGIEALARYAPQKILIHDGARPFASQDLISHVIAHLERFQGVIPAMPVSDTLKLAPGGLIARTVPRDAMWAAQTPQGFRFEDIRAAHRDAHASGDATLTDDAAVAERAGLEVAVIPGRAENRKLTLAEDITLADRQLTNRALAELPDIRMGQGIDFHVFEPGDHVVLCGVKIPHSAKLQGHSDADAALHALTDAILGAIGEGDIGVHFPPSDKKWKGAASAIFVEKAFALLRARGGLVANVDITILAEAPKIAPHLAAMKAVVSKLLGIAADRVAIKATTTEKLGAIGRKEGLAAFATATVRLPG
jgi:2-C-methyl-D-erythritol 4-phosphate cytidylyltransferase / 2-C-methyl-D-erythritol 2,4-cyclodiphosphate synthase